MSITLAGPRIPGRSRSGSGRSRSSTSNGCAVGATGPSTDRSPGLPGPAQHQGFPEVGHRTGAEVDPRAAPRVRAVRRPRTARPPRSVPRRRRPGRERSTTRRRRRRRRPPSRRSRRPPATRRGPPRCRSRRGHRRAAAPWWRPGRPGRRWRSTCSTRGLIGPAAQVSRARPGRPGRRSVSRGRGRSILLRERASMARAVQPRPSSGSCTCPVVPGGSSPSRLAVVRRSVVAPACGCGVSRRRGRARALLPRRRGMCGAIGPGIDRHVGCRTGTRRARRGPSRSARRSTPDPAGTARAPAGRRGRPCRRRSSAARPPRRTAPRSVLLTTNRSARPIPGPPLRATSPPPATSSTKICASTSAGEKVAVRLSPPDSTRTTSSGAKSASRSSTASRLAVTSSRIAVCGQAPVSTARIRSGSSTPAERRKRASSSV